MHEQDAAYAAAIVDHALDLGPGESVLITYDDPAAEFAHRVGAAARERGADAHYRPDGPVDAEVSIAAPHPDRVAGAYDSAAAWDRDVERSGDHRWLLCSYPTWTMADRSGTDPDDLADAVYSAVLQDWTAERRRMEPLRRRVTTGEEVRITGDRTDLYLDIGPEPDADRVGVIDDGRQNLPGGEVFTAPDHTAVDGTIHFDGTTYFDGHEIGGVTLTYEEGDLVWAGAETGADDLARLLREKRNMDRIGELGIGTNRVLDDPVGHLTVDEKRAGTVHLALGSAYPQCYATDGTRDVVERYLPDASSHLDFVTDLSGGELRIDGKPVVVDGDLVMD